MTDNPLGPGTQGFKIIMGVALFFFVMGIFYKGGMLQDVIQTLGGGCVGVSDSRREDCRKCVANENHEYRLVKKKDRYGPAYEVAICRYSPRLRRLEAKNPNRYQGYQESMWRAAIRKNTPGAYRKFIRDYPSSPHVPEAEQKTIELDAKLAVVKRAYQAAIAVGTSPAIERFLEEYGSSDLGRSFVNRARMHLDDFSKAEAAWQEAVLINTPSAYLDFRTRFLGAPQVEEASHRYDDLRKRESAAWQAAKRENTEQAYADFIEQYAWSEYRSRSARKRIAALRNAK